MKASLGARERRIVRARISLIEGASYTTHGQTFKAGRPITTVDLDLIEHCRSDGNLKLEPLEWGLAVFVCDCRNCVYGHWVRATELNPGGPGGNDQGDDEQ